MICFYLYDTDNECLIGTFEAANWEQALSVQNDRFGHMSCNLILRVTPHEYWD